MVYTGRRGYTVGGGKDVERKPERGGIQLAILGCVTHCERALFRIKLSENSMRVEQFRNFSGKSETRSAFKSE